MPASLGKKTRRQVLLLSALVVLTFAGLFYGSVNGGWQLVDSLGSRTMLTTLGFACILLCIAITAIVLLHRKQNLLDRFEEAARDVVKQDYASRIDIAQHHEFRALGRILNDLVDQLDDSLDTRRSLAEIDSLILSGADITAIIRRSLIAASLDAVETRLLLRQDPRSTELLMHKLDGVKVITKPVAELNITEEALADPDYYRELASRECGEVLDCYPISCEEQLAGALFAAGHRSLTASESKRLDDLVDRLSVAMTNIKRSDTLYQQAHFDALTGLINRRAFEERLKESLARSHRNERGALLFIDLDGFKKVNDTEGHEAGDQLLIRVGERLRGVMRPEDTIARLGGDEFAIIATGCGDDASIETLCERVITSVTGPVVVDRMEHSIGTSIGVARYPADGQSLEEIVMKADSAMYKAKQQGGSRFAFFDDSLKEANNHRILVETRLRNAIKEQRLELHFQPKLNLKTWTVDCAEALLRWRDDDLGDVSPNEFIPIAEDTGLIHDIMPIIVEQTTNLLARAEEQGVLIDSIAINASPKQIMTEGFALSILSLLDLRNTPHEKVEVEVTESVFAQDMSQVLTELHILRMAGIRVALDDFGTGYSSLNMLRELPLDVVKIDRAFITELESSDQARSMLKHLIDIASVLGLKVVAEGVETDTQLQYLHDNECDYVQGWLISKALSNVDFLDTMREWQSPQPSRSDAAMHARQKRVRALH
jgi:diguanylate cyclase (GGDEF)-like protein